MRSAIYEGTVTHRRPGPDGHRFTQPVHLVLVDLDEVDELCRQHLLWSSSHPAPVWLRRSDFLGDPATPLADAVRHLVAERTGRMPSGPVSLLTHPRTWGWSFNPISCYFCWGDDPSAPPLQMVAEVTNTPWRERHCYVVGPPGTHDLEKRLHVSPFLGMDLDYRLTYTEPGDRLDIGFSVTGSDGPALFAGVTLRRRPADRRSLGRLAWHPARGPFGGSAGIYRHALMLWAKGARFQPHPGCRVTSAPASTFPEARRG